MQTTPPDSSPSLPSYLTAAYTGLHQAELRQLVRTDVHLDSERPYLLTRATTTKNQRDAVIPLHPSLAAEFSRKAG